MLLANLVFRRIRKVIFLHIVIVSNVSKFLRNVMRIWESQWKSARINFNYLWFFMKKTCTNECPTSVTEDEIIVNYYVFTKITQIGINRLCWVR